MTEHVSTSPATWRALTAVAAVLFLALGVGFGLWSGRDQEARKDPVKSLPECSEVFRDGKTIDIAVAAKGCRDPQGKAHLFDQGQCKDKRTLFQVDAQTGAKEGWGFGGEPYHLTKGGSTANDPDYVSAYTTCFFS